MGRRVIQIISKINEVILQIGEIIFICVVIAVLLVSFEKIYWINKKAILSGAVEKRFIKDGRRFLVQRFIAG